MAPKTSKGSKRAEKEALEKDAAPKVGEAHRPFRGPSSPENME